MASSINPSTARPSWSSTITIDLLVHILNRSILHPFVAWLIPLCLRAASKPFHAPDVLATCAWAAFVTVLAVLRVVDRRIAFGAPREVDWADEVVVITGGASGLGRVIAQMYGMRGASVAVMDVRIPLAEDKGDSEADVRELDGVRFYQCDVADADAVERVRSRIEHDLGPPTILINNAAILHGKPLLSLSTAELQHSIHVNLLGPMHVLQAFLPQMLSSAANGATPGATIVTVASVLGKLGARNLTDYAAAKAGLIALHRSLSAELRGPEAPPGAEKVRAILVTPGQLGTGMFAGVRTPSPFWGPVVEPVELAKAIVTMVDAGLGGEISLPLYSRWIEWMGVLPFGIQRVARWMSGLDAAMDGFIAPRFATVEADKKRE